MWKEVNILSTNFSVKHTPSATLTKTIKIPAIFFSVLLSPFWEKKVQSFIKICIPLTHRCTAKLDYNWPSGSGCGPLFEKTLNPLYPSMLCAKFGWNYYSGSGEDEHVKGFWQCHWRQWKTTGTFWQEKLSYSTLQFGELVKEFKLMHMKNKANLYY